MVTYVHDNDPENFLAKKRAKYHNYIYVEMILYNYILYTYNI